MTSSSYLVMVCYSLCSPTVCYYFNFSFKYPPLLERARKKNLRKLQFFCYILDLAHVDCSRSATNIDIYLTEQETSGIVLNSNKNSSIDRYIRHYTVCEQKFQSVVEKEDLQQATVFSYSADSRNTSPSVSIYRYRGLPIV